MSNINQRSMVVESNDRVWPDEELREVARDVAEANGTWLWDAPEKLTREVWAVMLNKYGTTLYCGPTREQGIPFTTADVAHVATLIKGATVTLAPDPLPAAPSEDHVLVRWTEQIWTNWNCQAWIDPVKYEEITGEEIVEPDTIDEDTYSLREYLEQTSTFYYKSDPYEDLNNDSPWSDIENEGTPADHRAYEQSKLHPQGELEI